MLEEITRRRRRLVGSICRILLRIPHYKELGEDTEAGEHSRGSC